jgi:DNA-directed RNA polymerase specialized sigma24 family protein
MLDAGMRGWIKKTAYRHHWRVASYIDFEDLVQEGYLQFCRVRDRYGGDLDRRHFMSLLQRTYLNRITDMARERTRLHEVPVSALAVEKPHDTFEHLCGEASDATLLAALFVRAPEELRMLIATALSETGQRVLDATPFLWRDGERETSNERLCRILGLDPKKHNLATMLRDYISS